MDTDTPQTKDGHGRRDRRARADGDAESLPAGMDKVWMTAKHAADYLDFPNVRAFRLWVTRHQIPTGRRGKTLLFLRRDLDDAVRQGR